MDDLDKEVTPVADDVPPTEGEEVSTDTDTPTELTSEELESEVERLKEEAKATEDPKEKRHLEQQAGRLQQLSQAREKADLAEKALKEKEERLQKLEEKELEILYEKSQSETGLEFFESLYESDKDTAEKLAKEKYGTTAKKLIQETRKQLASTGDEKAQAKVTEDESDAKAEHKLAIRFATKTFSDLSTEEKETAQKYFDRIAGKGYLTIDEAEEFADMAKHYATKGRAVPPSNVEKEKILARNASTTGGKAVETKETEESLIQKFINLGYDEARATLMAKIK